MAVGNEDVRRIRELLGRAPNKPGQLCSSLDTGPVGICARPKEALENGGRPELFNKMLPQSRIASRPSSPARERPMHENADVGRATLTYILHRKRQFRA